MVEDVEDVDDVEEDTVPDAGRLTLWLEG